jgi:hypothetical protein
MMAQFIRIGVYDVLRTVDDATDHRAMTRVEALKFLEQLATEIEIRIDWVREAIKRDERQHHD